MENFSELIANRRSMRAFTGEPLTEDQKKAILRAALISPTSKNTRGWEFVTVEDKETLAKLATCKDNGASFLAQAAFAVVVMGDPTKTDAWIEDCAIAAITMQLQAADLGLGSCWAHYRNRHTADGIPAEQAVAQTLGIPEPYVPLCIIGFGYKGMDRKPYDDSKMQWEKIHQEKF
mgnify:CR=1 FL=1